MTDKLIIFDTTLRDGEQSPGASMTRDEKLRIARQLERLKVDVIEAGFPASSVGDFEAVQAIARAIKDATICGLSRANDRDISRAAEALKDAVNPRIHTFIATSVLHMEKKLRMTPDQVFEQAKQSVRFARNLVADVEFSPEDGYRSDVDFLCRVIEAVIAEGATTINVPDTVGYAIPELYGNFIKTLRERVPNSDVGQPVHIPRLAVCDHRSPDHLVCVGLPTAARHAHGRVLRNPHFRRHRHDADRRLRGPAAALHRPRVDGPARVSAGGFRAARPVLD